MEIFNIKRNNYDCSNNHYYFINDNAIMVFCQSLNCDLVFKIDTFPNNFEKVELIIRKN